MSPLIVYLVYVTCGSDPSREILAAFVSKASADAYIVKQEAADTLIDSPYCWWVQPIEVQE